PPKAAPPARPLPIRRLPSITTPESALEARIFAQSGEIPAGKCQRGAGAAGLFWGKCPDSSRSAGSDAVAATLPDANQPVKWRSSDKLRCRPGRVRVASAQQRARGAERAGELP